MALRVGGLLSCGNPLSILRGGGVFFGFHKNKPSVNEFSVLASFYFICLNAKFIFFQDSCVKWNQYLPLMWCGGALQAVCLCPYSWCKCVLVRVWAHVHACMPPCSPLICSGPLAGNLSIEIRKKNSREECLWFEPARNLQWPSGCFDLSLPFYLTLSHIHTHKHQKKCTFLISWILRHIIVR